MQLSKKILAIAPSLTLAIDAKAKSMKAEGLDVIGFGAGEPDFDTPQFIKNAAKEALDKGITKYTPAAGTMDLRKAIAKKLETKNGVHYEASQIVVSNGAKHSLFNAFAAILNPGDEVIVPVPFWVTYPELIQFNDGVPVYVESTEENGFVPTMDAIEKAITPKTKAIILNTPSNPSGAIYSESDIRKIAELAVKYNFFIVSDEIYEELIYDNHTAFSPAQISEDVKALTIIVNGFSKAYAMTGWRLGYTASTLEIAKAMGSLQSHATSNPNSMAQYAAVVALTDPSAQGEIDRMVSAFDIRRKDMVTRINAIDGLSCRTPEGAFYVMMNISKLIGKSFQGKTINGSMDFCDYLLEDQKVALVPGIAFGTDEFCRLSYATSDENIRNGLARVATFVSTLS